MKKKSKLVLTLAISASLAVLIILSGCTGATNSANDEITRNRAYMTQANQVMTEFEARLESFNDAVSRNDIVNMRTQADNAFRVLDELNGLTVPDSLKDVHDEYVAGSDALRESLNMYIALYSEVSNEGFDSSTYDSRIESVQQKYDEGVEHFSNGDQIAAEKPNDTEG